MAEHAKDPTDRWLESAFAAEPVADDGFSDRVVRRIRRRTRVRRSALGIAFAFGTLIAAKPAFDLLTLLYRLLGQLSGSLGSPADAVPSLAMLLAGGALFLAAFLGLRLLED